MIETTIRATQEKEQESNMDLILDVLRVLGRILLQDLYSHSLVGVQIHTPGDFAETSLTNKLQNRVTAGATEQSLTFLDPRCGQSNCAETR